MDAQTVTGTEGGDTMEGLKPCPFCGATPECGIEQYGENTSKYKTTLAIVICCPKCGCAIMRTLKDASTTCVVPFDEYVSSYNALIEKWNTRIPDSERQ